MKQETLKKIVELAEGFDIIRESSHWYGLIRYRNNSNLCMIQDVEAWGYCPLLLRRAVEGWNNSKQPYPIELNSDNVEYFGKDEYRIINNYFNYTIIDYLTPQEQAIEACLIELLEEK